MKTYTTEQLKEILKLHKKWLNGDSIGVRADLRYANLTGVNLTGADLRYADLRYANLGEADLRKADLRKANLYSADLRKADLREADLERAILWGTVGNKAEIKSMQLETYDVAYTKDRLQIGCKNHPINEWFDFDDDTIFEMDDNALAWWKKWKGVIKNTIDMSPAR